MQDAGLPIPEPQAAPPVMTPALQECCTDQSNRSTGLRTFTPTRCKVQALVTGRRRRGLPGKPRNPSSSFISHFTPGTRNERSKCSLTPLGSTTTIHSSQGHHLGRPPEDDCVLLRWRCQRKAHAHAPHPRPVPGAQDGAAGELVTQNTS